MKEGSGSVVLAPLHQPESTIPLAGPEYDTGPGFRGGLVYQYREVFSYHWVPDSEEDPPVDGVFTLEGTAEFQFTSNSGAMTNHALATASATLGGSTAAASYETTPGPYPWSPPTVNEQGTGTTALEVVVPLTGEGGEFTLTYSGQMSTDANGILSGKWALVPARPVGKFIQITSATGDGPKPVGPTDVLVKGLWWRNPEKSLDWCCYRVDMSYRNPPTALWTGGPVIGPPPSIGPSNAWQTTISFQNPQQNLQIRAVLMVKPTPEGEWEEAGTITESAAYPGSAESIRVVTWH